MILCPICQQKATNIQGYGLCNRYRCTCCHKIFTINPKLHQTEGIMEFKTANSHDTDRMNLCNEHAKGLIFLVTGFKWTGYRTDSTGPLGWYTGCDYGRNAPGTICNAPAEYLYERKGGM